MILALIIILLVLAVGGLPSLGYNTSYGYGPSGIIGLILVVVLVLFLLGRL